jgi:hypothetical protein
VVLLSCLLTSSMAGPGSPVVAGTIAGTIAGTGPAKLFGAAAVSFQQDVLVTDPAGKGRGISAPSLALPGGFRYQVRVRFLPEKVDKERRQDFLRTVTLYEWRGRPGADCASVACWVATAELTSAKSSQERFFDVPKDTRWLIAIWQLPPKPPEVSEGEDPPPVATCQDRGCWKIEDVQVGAEGGVLLEMATPDETTTLTVLQAISRGKRP